MYEIESNNNLLNLNSFIMKTLKFFTLILISLMILSVGCKKDEVKKDEFSQSIHNIVPDSIITNMKKLGMPINAGLTPPNLEKIYFASPFIMKATSDPYDYFQPGFQFYDYLVKFYDQVDSSLSIKLDYLNGTESGSGVGGFISGTNNSFSIFVKVHSVVNGDTTDKADMIQVISGTIVSGGVKNFYFANFMLNNYGNIYGSWMGEGKGRIIYDSDGFSPEQSSFVVPESKKKSAVLKSVSEK